MNRRNLLRVVGMITVSGVAGCSSNDSAKTATGAPDDTPTTAPDTPTGTGTNTPGDTTAPVIDAFSAQPTEAAGDVAVFLEGHDDENLATARLTTPTDEITRLPDETRVTVDTTLEGQPWQVNDVGARLTDAAGNTVDDTMESYIRTYDLLEDPHLDVGAVYISQQGAAFEQQCRDSYDGIQPAVGIYDDYVIPTDVSTRHIDQMTGHGINRLVYDYGGVHQDRDRGRRIRALLESSLIDQIEIEPFYTKTGMLWRMDENWKETVLPESLTYLRDTILSHDNVATIDGRPVVSTWNFTYFLDDDSDAKKKLLDEFGSYEAFVADMRELLRVDGTEPFLIVGKGPATVVEDSRIGDFVDFFDGMATWFPPGPWRRGEDDSWEAIIDRVETYFANNYQYAIDNDMEFTPRVFPGYDDRGSGCGRTGYKHFPRSTERFGQLLELAEKYATSGRIDVATWNDWTEGHQVEPGTFRGVNYGTAYLEIIEQFQRGDGK